MCLATDRCLANVAGKAEGDRQEARVEGDPREVSPEARVASEVEIGTRRRDAVEVASAAAPRAIQVREDREVLVREGIGVSRARIEVQVGHLILQHNGVVQCVILRKLVLLLGTPIVREQAVITQGIEAILL